MNVLILSAGVGSRLQPVLDDSIPKSLVNLGDENLLERQVRQVRKVPKEQTLNISAVVGKEGDCWNYDTRNKCEEIVDNVIVNEKNKNTESGYSFLLGLQSLSNSDTLVLLGDTVLDQKSINDLCTHSSRNVALAMALETKVGTNHGAYFSFEDGLITGCDFDINSNYAATGIMYLSEKSVRYLSSFSVKSYEKSNLASFIDKIAKQKTLTGYIINNSKTAIPTSSETLTQNGLYTNIRTQKRKDKILKSSSNNKMMRDRVNLLLYAQARHPSYFPDISNISLFGEESSYEVPNYFDQGYEPLSELLTSDLGLKRVIECLCKFILEEFGEESTPIPGLYKNTFLPNIVMEEPNNTTEKDLCVNIAQSDDIYVNDKKVPSLLTVINRLNNDSELIGRLEPNFIKEVHGDLRPNNVLVNTETEELLFTNPRGQTEIGTIFHDPLYDISKLLAYTKMNSIHHDGAETNINKRPGELNISYDLGQMEKRYDDVKAFINQHIEANLANIGPDWQVRLNMLSGLFLVCDSLSENASIIEEEIMYGCGIELVQTAIDEFEPISNRESNVVNINTGSDLKLARELFK